MDILKRISRKWWFVWVSFGAYLGLAIAAPIGTWLATIGKHGWKDVDTYDVLVLTVATVTSVCTTIKTYTSRDFGNAVDGKGINGSNTNINHNA